MQIAYLQDIPPSSLSPQISGPAKRAYQVCPMAETAKISFPRSQTQDDETQDIDVTSIRKVRVLWCLPIDIREWHIHTRPIKTCTIFFARVCAAKVSQQYAQIPYTCSPCQEDIRRLQVPVAEGVPAAFRRDLETFRNQFHDCD